MPRGAWNLEFAPGLPRILSVKIAGHEVTLPVLWFRCSRLRRVANLSKGSLVLRNRLYTNGKLLQIGKIKLKISGFIEIEALALDMRYT